MSKKVEQENQEKRSILYYMLGVLLLIIGVAGIILPILPGWPFIFLGLFLIGGMPLLDRIVLKYIPKKIRDRVFDPSKFEKKP